MNLYDNPSGPRVYCTLAVMTSAQATLLQEALQLLMVQRAGKPSERKLAEWNNSLENAKRRAKREKWSGWEASHAE